MYPEEKKIYVVSLKENHASRSLVKHSNCETVLQTPCKYGAQLGSQALVLRRPQDAGAMRIEEHADGGGKLRLYELVGHSGEGQRVAKTRRDAQQALEAVLTHERHSERLYRMRRDDHDP